MPIISGELTARITLRRLNDITKHYEDIADPTMWAAAEPQGDAHYRFRIYYRDDLRSKADIQPAMRVSYRGEELDLVDIIEAERRIETHLLASRRIIEEIDDLQAGVKGIKAWP